MLDQKSKRSKLYIEVLRIIACYLVIFNHNEGFLYFYEASGLVYWLYCFISILVKSAVPIFLAIAGALLLTKEESLRQVYKRVFRIMLVLVVFSWAYYVYDCIYYQLPFDFVYFFQKLYQSRVGGAYWYLYAYIAFLISAPLLRSFASSLSSKQFHYMFGLIVGFFGVLSVWDLFLWKGQGVLNTDLRVYWLTQIIVMYPMLGYYLENRVTTDTWNKKKFALLWCLNLFLFFVSAYANKYDCELKGSFSESYLSVFCFVNVATLYLTAKKLAEKNIFSELEKPIKSVGGATFGIYLTHMFILDRGPVEVMHNWLVTNLPVQMWGEMLYCFVIMMATYLVVLILKRCPGLKKLL